EGYSGARVMVGTRIIWAEATPRTNRSHFTEINLLELPGYSASYGDPDRPLCRDLHYDRCFYDPEGQHAEGREFRAVQQLFPAAANEWVHVQIPLSHVIRKLGWVSPPREWHRATLVGLYFGIESTGASRTETRFRNYQVYALGV